MYLVFKRERFSVPLKYLKLKSLKFVIKICICELSQTKLHLITSNKTIGFKRYNCYCTTATNNHAVIYLNTGQQQRLKPILGDEVA